MDYELEKLCDLLIDNVDVLHEVFRFDGYMNYASAVILTNEDVLGDPDQLKELRKDFRKRSSMWSNLRGFMESVMVVKMYMRDDPIAFYHTIKEMNTQINNNKIFMSNYAPLAAMIIEERVQPEQYQYYVDKTKAIYQKMKEEHSFLTSDNDIIFAALLAVSDINTDNLLLEMEENYPLLKGKIKGAPNLELSHTLALDLGAPGIKTARFLELYQYLKQRKLKFAAGKGLNALALLSLLDEDEDYIYELLNQVNEYLKAHKRFRGIHMFQSDRLPLAAMLVIKYLKPDDIVVKDIMTFVCLQQAIAAAAAAAAAA